MPMLGTMHKCGPRSPWWRPQPPLLESAADHRLDSRHSYLYSYLVVVWQHSLLVAGLGASLALGEAKTRAGPLASLFVEVIVTLFTVKAAFPAGAMRQGLGVLPSMK